MTFTAAVAQYPVERLASWESYAAKLERWVGEAAGRGAKLAVFPALPDANATNGSGRIA